jgi:hypothetical protein
MTTEENTWIFGKSPDEREEKALIKLKVKRKAALQRESQETGTNELARA